ncbi:MAG: hypothetical protein ABI462_08810 [Ignavibacteria bacterium]
MRSIIITLIVLLNNLLIAQTPPTPFLNPGEHWTNLWSVSYDYQSNGSIRYLVQNPENPDLWCAVFMAQQDSNSALGSQRFIYCAYSSNNGDSWNSNQVNLSTSSQGFPCITLKDSSPLVAFHQGGGLFDCNGIKGIFIFG